MKRVLVALLILAAMAVIGPLASASPPDDTWLGGLSDDGDLDDVVGTVFGMAFAALIFVAIATFAPPVLGLVPGPDPEPFSAIALSTRRGRAPPIIALLQRH